MNGASKILTVSYGTFSCTLEGFDEPFNTMKAIAEYFRDLAADDRYFGAEPPTPDAAMLHKIAEREVQRRVEAKIGDNGVHLRAQEPTVAALAVTEVPEPSALPTLIAVPDGVAARLAKIRASVAKGDAEIAPAAVILAEPEYTEDQHADEFVEDMADFAIFDDADIAPMDMPAAEPVASIVEDLSPAVPALAEPELSDDAFDDDMLADLAALDAPIAAQDPLDAAIAEMDAADMAVEDDAGFDISTLDLSMDVPEVAAEPVAIPQDDDLSSRLGALIDPDDTDDDITADPAPTWDAQVEDDMMAELDAVEVEDVAPAAEAEPEDIADDIEAALAEIAEVEIEGEPVAAETAPEAVAEEPAPELSDKIQRARARVIRIRRTTDIAVEPVVAEPVAEETPAPTLTVEAEADLERELASLEVADFAAPEVAVETPADDDAELRRQLAMIEDDATAIAVDTPPEPEETPAHAAIADAVQDAAVSRLMQQTQSEMAVPENRRRLSAIAHLKAAVAATVAERFGSKAKPEEVEATRAEPYRDDLARVVRPRRPEGSGTAPARPAPLVLVSEQRIDRPVVVAPATSAPATVTPVRPRRVSSSAALAPQLVEAFDDDEDDEDDTANIFTDARGFAEFADRLGAHSLPDMLEAAAAYAATVEGRPSFSRPQLMKQVSMATGDAEVSREDGLRSFGALLRDGRIVKVKRGQFALTDDSRFLAEAKKIAD